MRKMDHLLEMEAEANLDLAAAQARLRNVRRQIDATVDLTPYSSPQICDGCGEVLKHEADFWSHFEIPDRRYLNLGNCPNR